MLMPSQLVATKRAATFPQIPFTKLWWYIDTYSTDDDDDDDDEALMVALDDDDGLLNAW